VTFRYRDYADGGRTQRLTLDAVEFLRRFVQHVLPRGFVKIRHYGLLANGQRQSRLRLCRRLLLGAAEAAVVQPAQLRCCPGCGGTRLVYRELTRAPGPAASAAQPADSS